MIVPSYFKSLQEQSAKILNMDQSIIDKLVHQRDETFDKLIETSEAIAGPMIAIIEINGILMKHPSEMDMLMGAMDIDTIRYALQNAMEDDEVTEIILMINSPGGVTTGIEELGRYINDCSKVKDIYAYTDSMACSAAYWLMSQVSENGIFCSPTAATGNVGVFALVLDETGKMEKEGLKVNAFSSGKWKQMGHPFHTLEQFEKDYIQSDVEKQHEVFKKTILANRPNVSVEALEGLSYEGEEALKLNLVDGLIDSLDEMVEMIQSHNNDSEKNMKHNITAKVASSKAIVSEAVAPVIETLAAKPIPGLPGINEADGPNDSPDKSDPNRDVPLQDVDDKSTDDYQATKDHKEPDGDEDEECKCEKCGSTYKVKKSKKVEDVKESPDEEVEEEDEKEEEVPAKKMDAEVLEKNIVKIDCSKECNQNWKNSVSQMQVFAGIVTNPNTGLTEWQKAVMEFQNPKS